MDFNKCKVIVNGVAVNYRDVDFPKNTVYEVIKLGHRGPLFFQEHMSRLSKSLKSIGIDETLDSYLLLKDTIKLIEVNGNIDANITYRLSYDGKSFSRYVFYTEAIRIPESAYEEGVSVKTVVFKRDNPDRKVYTNAMQKLRAELKKEEDVYEYLLIDDDGNILEGARSNVFFFKGSTVYTAETGTVLSGITRSAIVSIIENNFEIEYKMIGIENISDMDGAFLTGTSPGVLPIGRIDDYDFDMSNYKICKFIASEYSNRIDEYYRTLNFFGGIESEYGYFKREIPLIGEKAFNRLSSASVMVVGLGGVGSAACEALARAGVGRLFICDFDSVDPSNINRQIIALTSNIGRKKTSVMADRILDINPMCRVEIMDMMLTKHNVNNILSHRVDYIVDAIDMFDSKIALITCAKENDIPIISAMGTGNKLNPLDFKVTDIYRTKNCPLAKKIRRTLKSIGINDLKVVFSEETSPIKPSVSGVISSISFVPPVSGYIMASEVVKSLILD